MLAVYVVKVASEQIGKEKQQVKRIQLSVDPHHLNNTVDDFSQHVTLRGRIKSVEDHGILVDLGNGRQGFCKFSNVEGDYVIETDEDASPGAWMLNEGRILDFILEDKAKVNLKSRVVSLCLTKSLAERVDPSSYHPMLQDLNPGSLVSCKIDALARNGLLVSFAVFRGAIHVNHLGANWIPTNKQGSDTEWKAVFADVRNFTARIIAVDVKTKLIRLSIQPHILTLSEQPTLPAVGTVIDDSTVIRLDPGIGALLSLPPIETPIKVTIPSLRKNESYCEAVQRPAVYVHISKTTADRIVEVDFAREYAPSTRHKVRILSTSHLLDGTATGATAPNIVNAHVLQHSDLVIGKVYRNVPVYGNLEGGSVLVDFGMGIHGLIPVIHLFDKSNMTADHMSKLRKEKFALGNKVDVRILSLDSKMKRCIVTAKKNLIKATDCITDFSDLQTNQRITGYISRIDDSCLYVTFFNKVYGRVTAKSLVAELGIEDHRIDYSVGDVVKCRVVSCRRRVGKSLDTYAEEDIDETGSENRNHGFWDLNLSLNVGDTETNHKEGLNIVDKIEVRSGEILSPNSMKVIDLIPSIDRKRGEGFIPGHAIVRVLSSLVTTDANDKSYIECKVPYDHILDSYDEKDVQSKEAMDEFAKLFFKIGKKIDTEGIILFDPKKSKDEYASGIGKLPVVSLRHKMIDQARKNTEIGSGKNTILIPSGETNLFVGALVLGVVHQSDPRFGAFVKFLDNLTGLIPNTKKGKSMKKWETVLCKVVALDVTALPPKILLQKASVKATSISSIEIPIKVGDKIGAAEVVDTDFCRALLKIKDKSLDSFGKLQARIHVSMVQSTPIAIPKYKKGIGNSQSDVQAKVVPKSHPFYGWKQGTVLKDLVCVSTHSNHGTLFVELSNRIGVCKNPSLLAKEVSALKPGTKISVVIVGISKSKRGVWAQPYPNITCFIPALELCQDDRILNALEAYFPVGTRLECIVMDKVAWRKRENWGSKAFQGKSDEVRRTTNKAETPYLSFLLAQGTTSLEKPKRGDIAIGRINRKLRLYRAPSLMLELRGGYHGRCCITELEEPDEWTNMPLGRQQSAMIGGEVTSPNLIEEDNVHSDDEAQSDDDDLKER
jgi:ribosomal protein S1